MATGRGALAIDSVRQSVRAGQRSGQAGCVGGRTEEGIGRLRRQGSGAEEGRGAAAFCRPGGAPLKARKYGMGSSIDVTFLPPVPLK